MTRVLKAFCTVIVVLTLNACTKKADTLFRQVPSDESGIDFSNDLHENDTINILKLEYIYNGGAVATGDFNNDGLTDIFFSGNQVSNRLYMNKGGLKFTDVTEKAGVEGTGKWRAGVALADINNDGLLDIYVCATIEEDSTKRSNILYINKGIGADGVPSFADEAVSYGVADTGYSQNAAFLDYDLDGDLDLYILTNAFSAKGPSYFREKVLDGSSPTTDRLYRNNGDHTFTNVSSDAGIRIEGYGLGLAIADFNNDRWPDIYVSNDYLTNDILYINNQNGTFTNHIDDYIRHQSQFSMGNDVGDVNNDALPDIITMDMLPEGNLRRKTIISGVSYVTYINAEKFGYAQQYVRNMLQLNNGNGTFSEVGQLAGIHQTEWSWSPLLADIDNDGYQDLLVTNGFPKDITDKDFGNYRNGPAGRLLDTKMLIDSIPIVKIPNYGYKNNGDLTFTDVTNTWGIAAPSFSNGAAFADLDNDGDLDYIVNNINDPAFLFENTLYGDDKEKVATSNFLRLKLKGDKASGAMGAKITIRYDGGKVQYRDHSLYRGYLSTVEDVVHFGLGSTTVVDTIEVRWPDGRMSIQPHAASNQVLTIKQSDGFVNLTAHPAKAASPPIFSEDHSSIPFSHDEDDKIDFNIQRTLPHKYSQYGPGLAVADVNGDKLEDLYIGGSAARPSTFFIQNRDGSFTKRIHLSAGEKPWEDLGVLFFDADNDGDNDLYTVTGSIEWETSSDNYRDRLYKNDGKGNFREATDALPALLSSGSCVRSADYDGDGDLDLFVGGRVIPGKYPLAPESFILNNDRGKFTDVTDNVSPGLKTVGMITDALWSDFDNDGKTDLILSGELMPVTFFRNTGNGFTNITGSTGTQKFSGWWNSLSSGDFDNDGDIDYVAGNLGQNNYYRATLEEPVKVVAKDFDGNGSIDPVISCYFRMEDGQRKLCPVHFWDELNSLSPKFRRRFSRYKQYGKTTLDQLLSPADMEGALVLEAGYAASSYFENLGNGKFIVKALPLEAQFSAVNGLLADDFNSDGNLDILLTGNDYGNEVFSGRLDAFIGLMLQGDGKGNFKTINSSRSGFTVNGDGKALAKLYSHDHKELVVASQNKDSLKVFARQYHEALFEPAPMDRSVEIVFANGSKRKVELNYGSGFLSQSSRKIILPTGTREVIITDYSGKSRTIKY